MTDFLGDAPAAEPDYVHVEKPPSFWREPMTLGLLTVVLATLSLMHTALFNGRTYTLYWASLGFFTSSDSDTRGPSATYLEAGAWISVGLALLVALVAAYGRRRLVEEDPRWVRGLLEAALGIALVSTALHVALAVVIQVKGSGSLGLLVNG